MGRSVIVFSVIISLLCGRIDCSKYSSSNGVDEKWHKSEDDSVFYIESEQKFNWFDAWNECARRNMSLIAIDSYRKHLQIDALIRKLFPACPLLWLGGHDNAIDLRYEWATTGEVFSFTNWGANEPDRLANEHCILLGTTAYQWRDLNCVSKVGFICEENRFHKKLESLKQACQEKAHMKNAVMHFKLSPRFEFSN